MAVFEEGATDALTYSTSHTIVVGDIFEGHAEDANGPLPQGFDWVKVELEAGKKYRFLYEHVENSGDDYWSDFELRDSGGQLVDYTEWNLTFTYEDVTSDKALQYTPANNEVYYIALRNKATSHQFDYRIAVYEVVPVLTPPTKWTNKQFVDQLVNGYWEDYRNAEARKFKLGADNEITVNLTGLTFLGKLMAKTALSLWESVSGLKFKKVSSSKADIIIDDENSGAHTEFELRNNKSFIKQAKVNIDKDDPGKSKYIESYHFQTFIHEIGHALGLGHLGNYNANAKYATDGSGDNDALNDSWQKSVMSYFNQNENTKLKATLGYAITPMLIDILAIQKVYKGLSPKHKNGDTVYNLKGKNLPQNDFDVASTKHSPYALTLFDTGGKDTFDASSTKEDQFAKLKSGSVWNIDGGKGNFVVGPKTVIENFKGGDGVDIVTGNNKANEISGSDGNDILKGLGGVDTLDGGRHRDILFGGSEGDTLLGQGGVDRLNGGPGGDTLKGGAKKDFLIPGTGRDKMWGGGGNDIFIVGKNEDVNKIFDFQDGHDQIDLSDFGYKNKKQAIGHFAELGKKNDDKVMFADKGTKIGIKGIDLKDVTPDDLII